jgi:tetratricopeptide (TPR) repeat protein
MFIGSRKQPMARVRTIRRELIFSLITLGSFMGESTVFARSSAADQCLNHLVEGDDHINACTVAIKQDRLNDALWYARGISWKAKGDYDRAISDLSQAIKLNPDHVGAYFNRSEIFRDNKGDYDRAASDNERYLALQYPGYYGATQRDSSNGAGRGGASGEDILYVTLIGFAVAIALIAISATKRSSEKTCSVSESRDLSDRTTKCDEEDDQYRALVTPSRDDFLARLTILREKEILTDLEFEEEKDLISRIV